MGADGQTYHIDSIVLKEVCSEPSTTISGSLDGGARLVWKLHLHPSHRDFALAVAALQALIQPKPTVPFAGVHPGVGLRWCGEEEHGEEFVYLSADWRMRFYDKADHFCGPWDLERRTDDRWNASIEPGPSISLLAFEAGRRYERERG